MQLKCLLIDIDGASVKQHSLSSTDIMGLQISLIRDTASNMGYIAAVWQSQKDQPLTLIEDFGDSQYTKILVLISSDEFEKIPDLNDQEAESQGLYYDTCGTTFEPDTADTSFVISIGISDLPDEGMIYQIIILKNRVNEMPTKLLLNKLYQMPASGWIRANIDLRIR
jgi:hypothetical protein